MKTLMALVLMLLVPFTAHTSAPVVSAAFHFTDTDACVDRLIYLVGPCGELYMQTQSGMDSGAPPSYEGNVWGGQQDAPAPAPESTGDPCEFAFLHFITDAGDVYLQTFQGVIDGTPATWLGNFWGSTTAAAPLTWGRIKALDSKCLILDAERQRRLRP